MPHDSQEETMSINLRIHVLNGVTKDEYIAFSKHVLGSQYYEEIPIPHDYQNLIDKISETPRPQGGAS